MKKFYLATIALSLAATAGAMQPSNVEYSMVSRQRANSGFTTPRHKSAPTRAAAETSSILGKWAYDEYRAVSGGGWYDGFCYPEIVAGNSENEVIINGFWIGSNEDGFLGSVHGTFDPAAGTLTIPMGQKLGTLTTRDGQTIDAYMYLQDWNTFVCSTDPLVLDYDPSTHALTWMCDFDYYGEYQNNIIVSDDPNGFGKSIEMGVDYIVAIEMHLYNGYMLTTLGGQEGTCVVYAERTDDGFTVDNLGDWGFGAPVTFTVDKANKTVSAPATLYMADANLGSTYADVYFAAPDGGNINGTYMVSSAASDGVAGESIVYLRDWCMYAPSLYQPVSDTFTDTTLQLPFDLSDGSGVESVECDNNAVAEYYTLQGVRVERPMPGSLVIERRGNTATKIIMR